MEQKTEQSEQTQVRKLFQKPRLHIYGHINDITKTTTTGTANDKPASVGPPPHKTAG